MRKVNDLFGKTIINQATGEKMASVRDVVLAADSRSIVALLIDGSSWLSSSSRTVRWSSVVSVGDVVVIRGDSEPFPLDSDEELANLHKHTHRITGTKVINDKGNQIGSVDNMFFNEQGEITALEISPGLLSGNKYLPIEHVRAIGRDAVLSDDVELQPMKAVHQGETQHSEEEPAMVPPVAEQPSEPASEEQPYAVLTEERPPEPASEEQPYAVLTEERPPEPANEDEEPMGEAPPAPPSDEDEPARAEPRDEQRFTLS